MSRVMTSCEGYIISLCCLITVLVYSLIKPQHVTTRLEQKSIYL